MECKMFDRDLEMNNELININVIIINLLTCFYFTVKQTRTPKQLIR